MNADSDESRVSPDRQYRQQDHRKLLGAQLQRFTYESIRARRTRTFDLNSINQILSTSSIPLVETVDIGGDKLMAIRYAAGLGVIKAVGAPNLTHSTNGVGYLEAIEDVVQGASLEAAPLGVAYAGPVSGTRILAGINVSQFASQFAERYDADFSRLYTRSCLVNDAEAALFAAALEAAKRLPNVTNTILAINGSGLNCAVLKGNSVFTTEAGHVPADESLNPFGQDSQCGMFGAAHVCIESIAASKAGIETLWWKLRQEACSGREIAKAFVEGDPLASELYEYSVWATAHMVVGTAQALGLAGSWENTAIVGHGGTFQVPGYGERLKEIVDDVTSNRTNLFLTSDFTQNACNDGAAIAALALNN